MRERDQSQAPEQNTQLMVNQPGLDPRMLSPVSFSIILKSTFEITWSWYVYNVQCMGICTCITRGTYGYISIRIHTHTSLSDLKKLMY